MTVRRRQLGPDGPSISQLTFGAMRLGLTMTVADATRHLCHLHDLGIDTHHSSHEYESHELYLAALTDARQTGRRFKHIVKLSEPSFDHERFDPKRLAALIDSELQSLNVERISSLQWLCRMSDPQDSAIRVSTVTAQQEEIVGFFDEQVDRGRIDNVSIFPYTVGFADAAIDLGLAGTLATYLNPLEVEYGPMLDRVASFIAIRPFAGGRIGGVIRADRAPEETRLFRRLGAETAHDEATIALRFALLHPAVSTAVVSVHSEANLEHLVDVAGDLEPDVDAFEQLVGRVLDGANVSDTSSRPNAR